MSALTKEQMRSPIWGIDSNAGPFTANDGIMHFGMWCDGATGKGDLCKRNHTERHPWPTCWASGAPRPRSTRTEVSVLPEPVNCPDCIEWMHA